MAARLLVAAVVIMGIMIFAGLALIGARLSGLIGAPGDAACFGSVPLALPEGCTIAEARAGEGRLVLRLEGLAERGCRQVIVLDLESGEELGRVTAEPQ